MVDAVPRSPPKPLRLWKRVAFALLQVLFSIGLVLLLGHFGSFAGIENGLADAFFRIRQPPPGSHNPLVSDRVRLCAFDEDSLHHLGRWPWKRYVHARFLERLQAFQPRAVMFDLLFVDPDKVPPFLLEQLDADPGTLQRIEDVYREMDMAMAHELGRYRNVYIDLQLMDRPRAELPPETIENIALNEALLARSALTDEGHGNAFTFSSLEPILPHFIGNARPAIINVPPDRDGKMREFPLFYYYATATNTFAVPTTILTLYADHCRVPHTNIHVRPGAVVLRGAYLPDIDPATGGRIANLAPAVDLLFSATNPTPPEEYPYSTNLYRMLCNQATNPAWVPPLPVSVYRRPNGYVELLDGWEILQAVTERGCTNVLAIEHRQEDVVIPVVTDSRIRINFAGREGYFFQDPETGRGRMFHRIPTESYQGISEAPPLPPVPLLDADGHITDPAYDRTALETWFLGHCDQLSKQVRVEAEDELGADTADTEKLLAFIAREPATRSFFLYRHFLNQAGAWPGSFSEVYPAYPEFAAAAGQPPGFELTEKRIVTALMEHYDAGFRRYRNQIVLAGGTALGIGDDQRTPVGPMFGIHVIINALNTLVTRNLLFRTSDFVRVDLWLLLGVCLAGTALYMCSSVRLSWAYLLIVTGGLLGGAYLLFAQRNLQLTTVPLLLGNLLCFINVVAYKLFTEERDRRYLQRTFKAYLSPEVIDEMYHSRSLPTLGGETRVATAYFTDIAGFSSFSECLTPKLLLELLNEYLTAMTDILLDEKGTLDKYEGDAIVAFFGAPTHLPDHAGRAVHAALRMQARLAELRAKWSAEQVVPGEPERNTRHLPAELWAPGDKWPRLVHDMHMRIGINTGDIIVGNMGSNVRMNYTMMGDSVNLAARLESAAKQYGIHTLASGSAMDAPAGGGRRVRDTVVSRQVDRVMVVGRSQPVDVYEIIAPVDNATADERMMAKLFETAMQAYFAGDWVEAERHLNATLALESRLARTSPSKVLLERCHAFRNGNPPPPGWNGAWKLESK